VKCNVEGVLVSEWQRLEMEEMRLEQESKTALRLAKENLACHERLKRQRKFLKSKGKDMVCYSLKTMDKLDEVEEKEKQIESKQAATAAMPFNIPVLSITEANPFASLEVLLLPPKV
jgi:CO dehydrogenase/acetyl-CoA synthase beta subunit